MSQSYTGDRPWLGSYPPGVAADIDLDAYSSLNQMIDDCLSKNAGRIAYTFMGSSIGYDALDAASLALAAWMHRSGLRKGDRIALMMPNVPQYPVAVIAALRAGLIVVNVNPLYTARELEHQLRDSGAKAIVILENFAHTLAQCLERTAIEKIVLAGMGDMLGGFKRVLVDFVVRKVRKLVPPYQLPGAIRFNDALSSVQGEPRAPIATSLDDVCVLQYTGGTTGIAKGATLRQRNLLANVLQCHEWYGPMIGRIPAGEQPVQVCALPLYHIFAFTTIMLLSLRLGARVILIPNARDIESLLKELSASRFHILPGVNTLFNALLNHRDFRQVDWSHLKLAIGGGMSVQKSVASRWQEATGCVICEGYGLSETAPTASCNPVTASEFSGSIGLPLPSTWIKCVDGEGRELPAGESGEIVIKGPQVMAGYWERDDESARAFTSDGYFRTGDIGVMDPSGFLRINDRKKDMILVSGFNVYPNEIEAVVGSMPEVLECAAIGIPDPASGEAVKLVVVRRDAALGEDAVRRFCRENLTGYKQPRVIEFRDELPKSQVGKILRFKLRADDATSAPAC